MSYKLKSITIRTNNSKEGMQCINDVWTDISSGKLPLLFDSNKIFQQGISPVSKYSNYSNASNGEYDLTIMAVTSDFFRDLEEKTEKNIYKKYDAYDENGNINVCAEKAWKIVWAEEKSGLIKRSFTEDYESTVPAKYTKDGKAHCYLYIALK